MEKNNCGHNLNPCFGCGACYAICPVSAISISINSNGFYEAKIDEEQCISCGKCKKVCLKYMYSTEQLNIEDFKIYSFIHKDKDVLNKSSSGAISWALIQHAIQKGYKVAGVEYDYISNIASTFIANNLQDAEKTKGSKYLQSNTSIFKILLNSNEKFIVFGTPCQIAGLHNALNILNKRNNFLLIDCFCHGVPTYLLWHSFLKYINIETLQKIEFRTKKSGWHNFCMKIQGDKKEYKAESGKNPFYKLFFSDLLLNDSCYNCNLKSSIYSDIRIGDFWGAEYSLNETGVSLVVPITETGKKCLLDLKDLGLICSLDKLRSSVTKVQSAFKKTNCDIQKRKKIFYYLYENNFKDAFDFYQSNIDIKNKIKNKIKTFIPKSILKYIYYFFYKLKGF